MFKLLKLKDEKPLDTLPIPKDMTLDEARLALLELMGQEGSNHYRMGQLFNHVVDHKLAEAAGYKSAQDYFSQHLIDMSRSSLMMYGAVARNFSEPISRRFGITCLYLLLTYAEVADMALNHELPGALLIEVPADAGQVTTKSFDQCTVDELRKAIQRKRKPASSKPLPAEDMALADRYREAVTGGLPKGTSLAVQLRNHKGTAVLDFKGIPLTQVAQLAQVLLAQLPPQPELTQAQKAPQSN
jgi:hypothetical protein